MAGTGMRMRLHRGILIYILSFALHATAGGAHSVTSSFSLLSPPPPVCAMLLQADMSKRHLSFRNLPQGLGHYGDLSNIVRRGCGAAVIHLSDMRASIVSTTTPTTPSRSPISNIARGGCGAAVIHYSHTHTSIVC